MPSSQQTLTNTAISLSGGQTTMTFTKLLSEPGELEISSTGATTLVGGGTKPKVLAACSCRHMQIALSLMLFPPL